MWANPQTGFNPTTPAPTPDQFSSGQPASQGSGGRRRGRWIRRRFTPAGQMLLATVSLSAVFGVDTTQTLAFQVFALSFGLILLAFATSWLCRARIRIRRVMPPFASMGEPLFYRIEVENRDGMLRDITALIGDLELPLTGTTARVSNPPQQAIITVDVTISGWLQCVKFISLLGLMDGVIEVRRNAV